MKRNIKSHALTFLSAAAVAGGLYAFGTSLNYYLQDDTPLKPTVIQSHIVQGGECVALEIEEARKSGLAINSLAISRANRRCGNKEAV